MFGEAGQAGHSRGDWKVSNMTIIDPVVAVPDSILEAVDVGSMPEAGNVRPVIERKLQVEPMNRSAEKP